MSYFRMAFRTIAGHLDWQWVKCFNSVCKCMLLANSEQKELFE